MDAYSFPQALWNVILVSFAGLHTLYLEYLDYNPEPWQWKGLAVSMLTLSERTTKIRPTPRLQSAHPSTLSLQTGTGATAAAKISTP